MELTHRSNNKIPVYPIFYLLKRHYKGFGFRITEAAMKVALVMVEAVVECL